MAMELAMSTPCSKWSQPAVPQKPRPSSLLWMTGPSTMLFRARSCELTVIKPRFPTLRRACPAGLDSAFSDDDFAKKMQELLIRLQATDDEDSSDSPDSDKEFSYLDDSSEEEEEEEISATKAAKEPPADWAASVGEIALGKSKGIPLSSLVRMMKGKGSGSTEEATGGLSAAAYSCSVKKSFSSMVFMMRELLCYEEVLFPAQKEMQASFVSLFERVFSRIPTLVVYVIVFLANFTAHCISGANAATASKALTVMSDRIQEYDASAEEEESRLWNSIVEEAARMQAELRGEALDAETVCWFVSPVTAKMEKGDGYPDYWRTEVMYQVGLGQEPNNSLLLANYAQFLFLVHHDHVRAEEHFKLAVEANPKDAESFNKYANFLWRVEEDLLSAEQNFLEAMSMEPDNSFYAASYAHFLWNTGCKGICFLGHENRTNAASL